MSRDAKHCRVGHTYGALAFITPKQQMEIILTADGERTSLYTIHMIWVIFLEMGEKSHARPVNITC